MISRFRENLPEYQREWSESKILMHFWRLPSIYINDIEECICEEKDTSKIKQHLIYKIVPSMIPLKTFRLLENHVKNVCEEKNIQNKVECVLKSQSRPWYEDFMSPNYVAATRAVIQVIYDYVERKNKRILLSKYIYDCRYIKKNQISSVTIKITK